MCKYKVMIRLLVLLTIALCICKATLPIRTGIVIPAPFSRTRIGLFPVNSAERVIYFIVIINRGWSRKRSRWRCSVIFRVYSGIAFRVLKAKLAVIASQCISCMMRVVLDEVRVELHEVAVTCKTLIINNMKLADSTHHLGMVCHKDCLHRLDLIHRSSGPIPDLTRIIYAHSSSTMMYRLE
jgi:hypothetical protein